MFYIATQFLQSPPIQRPLGNTTWSLVGTLRHTQVLSTCSRVVLHLCQDLLAVSYMNHDDGWAFPQDNSHITENAPILANPLPSHRSGLFTETMHIESNRAGSDSNSVGELHANLVFLSSMCTRYIH